jgi:micrococcal nuclease
MLFFEYLNFRCSPRWPLPLLVAAVLVGPVAAWAQSGVAAGASAGQASHPLPFSYAARVTRVFDGDTLWVKPLAGGRYRKLRLDGVDAPEICQAGGPAAQEALATRVLNQVVTVNVRAFDSYGRGLAQVSVDGQDAAAQLVRGGYAWSSRWQRSRGPYVAEEALARSERKGIFGVQGAELPYQFRRRHGPCPMP